MVHIVVVDLGDLAQLDEALKTMWTNVEEKEYKKALFFQNAGSIGELMYTQEWSNITDVQNYMNFNVVSMMWLTKKYVTF